SGIYFYDNASTHFFYTSPSFPFPYLYDFSLNTVLYYYPDPHNPGHYTTNPRYFYNFATGQIITMLGRELGPNTATPQRRLYFPKHHVTGCKTSHTRLS